MGCDGNEHILVECELLLDVDKQRVDLVRVRVVYGSSDGHRERRGTSGDESATSDFLFAPGLGFRMIPMMFLLFTIINPSLYILFSSSKSCCQILIDNFGRLGVTAAMCSRVVGLCQWLITSEVQLAEDL
jgi:hypothetical protein